MMIIFEKKKIWSEERGEGGDLKIIKKNKTKLYLFCNQL
mgnify:CR=1 FL=1